MLCTQVIGNQVMQALQIRVAMIMSDIDTMRNVGLSSTSTEIICLKNNYCYLYFKAPHIDQDYGDTQRSNKLENCKYLQ